MVQRYKFESKSQQIGQWRKDFVGCFQWFKGTNLKANHNYPIDWLPPSFAVSNGSKVQIWKQITTIVLNYAASLQLFPMVQRYKFESKSQLKLVEDKLRLSCFQWFKGTNLKANHNGIRFLFSQYEAVSNGSKVQIWKQITTVIREVYAGDSLFPMVQRYKFESKSQLFPLQNRLVHCCFQWFKGTNLKANHNSKEGGTSGVAAVSNGSKVQIWKQITTIGYISCAIPPLFPMVQRYKFESKSQLHSYIFIIIKSCFQWFKGTNLKANHN